MIRWTDYRGVTHYTLFTGRLSAVLAWLDRVAVEWEVVT